MAKNLCAVVSFRMRTFFRYSAFSIRSTAMPIEIVAHSPTVTMVFRLI